ncbi:DUF2568 domain-containing protein [Companilactobacillus kimchiensis]|uniref:DUF2568 domain-containing protein n=1 Tax=Companilactobacillus kimchiensis TaxID=993692 RepID=UPI003B8352A7
MFPIIFAIIWSFLVAPHSARKVGIIFRIIIELIVFGTCSLLLFVSGSSKWGLIYVCVVFINTLLVHILEE